MKKPFFLLIVLGLMYATGIDAKTYFVAVDGNDQNAGSKEAPLASIMKAQELVQPGDSVFIRGGKYILSDNLISAIQKVYAVVNLLDKSGTADKRICYWAFPGEHPVFDLSNVKPENKRVMVFNITGSWIHLKGLEVIGTQVTIPGHTQSECFHSEGSHNIYEQLSMHDGQAIGFYLLKGSDNLILNCDAYRNYDYTSENGKGGNSDGFGCHPMDSGAGNVFRG